MNNDYPPERVVLDIFETCQDLARQGMITRFENYSGDTSCVYVAVFTSDEQYSEWRESDGDPEYAKRIFYNDEGYNYNALCDISMALIGFKVKDEVEI